MQRLLSRRSFFFFFFVVTTSPDTGLPLPPLLSVTLLPPPTPPSTTPPPPRFHSPSPLSSHPESALFPPSHHVRSNPSPTQSQPAPLYIPFSPQSSLTRDSRKHSLPKRLAQSGEDDVGYRLYRCHPLCLAGRSKDRDREGYKRRWGSPVRHTWRRRRWLGCRVCVMRVRLRRRRWGGWRGLFG